MGAKTPSITTMSKITFSRMTISINGLFEVLSINGLLVILSIIGL
jgi:hypothetical protein